MAGSRFTEDEWKTLTLAPIWVLFWVSKSQEGMDEKELSAFKEELGMFSGPEEEVEIRIASCDAPPFEIGLEETYNRSSYRSHLFRKIMKSAAENFVADLHVDIEIDDWGHKQRSSRWPAVFEQDGRSVATALGEVADILDAKVAPEEAVMVKAGLLFLAAVVASALPRRPRS